MDAPYFLAGDSGGSRLGIARGTMQRAGYDFFLVLLRDCERKLAFAHWARQDIHQLTLHAPIIAQPHYRI
jgi:hypothetical protein